MVNALIQMLPLNTSVLSKSCLRIIWSLLTSFCILLPVDALCSLAAAVAGDAKLSGELARFALNIRSTRKHLFRQLSSDGPSGRALVAARSAALLR